MAAAPDAACLSEMGGATGQNLSLSVGPGHCNQSTIWALPYSPEATAVLSTAITLMMMITIVGNVLVIIAVLTSRSLQGPQNLFLVSLAAADILVATLIIPFSLANELQGYWAFQTVWCEIYLALDVLFCTSSIVHLCAISLDRYLSISRPVSYGPRRTPRCIKAAIVVVWLIAAVISFPPLLSLDKSEGGVEVCELNSERWYILYSTIGSFFAPCVIMILVYVRIYQIAKQHTRCPPGEKRREASGDAAALDKGPKPSSRSERNGGRGESERAADQSPVAPPVSPPSPAGARPAPPDDEPAEIRRASSPPDPAPPAACASTSVALQAEQPQAVADPRQPGGAQTQPPHEDSSSSGSEAEIQIGGRGGGGGWHKKQRGANKKAQTTMGPPPGKGFKGQIRSLTQRCKGTVATPSGTRLASDAVAPRPEGVALSRRKALMKRETRFTFVLAVVIGVFVVCWFPFFFSYSLVAVCKDTCSLPKPLFKFFFWIGYCNSCLNPIIYTIFNKDFRKAFKKILCRKNSKGTYF